MCQSLRDSVPLGPAAHPVSGQSEVSSQKRGCQKGGSGYCTNCDDLSKLSLTLLKLVLIKSGWSHLCLRGLGDSCPLLSGGVSVFHHVSLPANANVYI